MMAFKHLMHLDYSLILRILSAFYCVLLVLDFVPFGVVSEAFVEHREHLERES